MYEAQIRYVGLGIDPQLIPKLSPHDPSHLNLSFAEGTRKFKFEDFSKSQSKLNTFDWSLVKDSFTPF